MLEGEKKERGIMTPVWNAGDTNTVRFQREESTKRSEWWAQGAVSSL